MEQIFALMLGLGGFSFIMCGICIGNSIEAKESVIVANILTGFSVLGVLSFVIGFIGLIAVNL